MNRMFAFCVLLGGCGAVVCCGGSLHACPVATLSALFASGPVVSTSGVAPATGVLATPAIAAPLVEFTAVAQPSACAVPSAVLSIGAVPPVAVSTVALPTVAVATPAVAIAPIVAVPLVAVPLVAAPLVAVPPAIVSAATVFFTPAVVVERSFIAQHRERPPVVVRQQIARVKAAGPIRRAIGIKGVLR
ncbi:MAG TPA: hypothetical protein VFE24_15105 [Pirellulales bacterium]|nr:hypothetical protein [Pirellulales bacterium]